MVLHHVVHFVFNFDKSYCEMYQNKPAIIIRAWNEIILTQTHDIWALHNMYVMQERATFTS